MRVPDAQFSRIASGDPQMRESHLITEAHAGGVRFPTASRCGSSRTRTGAKVTEKPTCDGLGEELVEAVHGSCVSADAGNHPRVFGQSVTMMQWRPDRGETGRGTYPERSRTSVGLS